MLPWFSPTCWYPHSTPLVFVPRHAPLPLTPQTHLNAFPTSLSRKEEKPNRLLSKSHEMHCDLLMTESAAMPRTHLTQAQKTKSNKKKKKKKKHTLQSCSRSTTTIIQQPLQEEAHIMIPLVRLHGCIIH
jgi:hypothetical protein